MPFDTFNDDISGVGSASLGGSRVYYVAWIVTTDGPRVRQPQELDDVTLNGVGFFSLGNDLTPHGIITGIGWAEQIWMNSRIGQWITPPSEIGGAFPTTFADHIRWSLSAGTVAHLYVLGDS